MRRLPLLLLLGTLSGQKADIRVDVDLVTVPCSVTDRGGAPAKGLAAADFILRDQGKRRAIDHFWQESDLPLTLGLIVDVSGSQSAFVDSHRQTMERFLSQVMGSQDRAFLVAVESEARLIVDLTGSVEELKSGLTRMGQRGEIFGDPCHGGCGGTALWNGIHAAASLKLRWLHERRKALVVLSDGMDTGSPHSLSDTIEALQDAETVVFAIKYVDPALRTPRIFSYRPLERLTDETGGYTFPDPGEKLGEVFTRIEDELRNLYVLGFAPPEEAHDGRFHKLEVKTVRKNLVVRARQGYFAREGRK